MADTTGMEASVANAETVNASAVVLIDGFTAQLDAAIAEAVAANDAADLSALTALSDRLKSSSDALAAAVARNTIAEDEEPAPPTP
jgi:hypothetical protein